MMLKKISQIKPIKSKQPMILLLVLSLMMSVLSGCSTSTSEKMAVTTPPEYAEAVFGRELIDIEILADEAQWQSMLDNAKDEAYIKVDVIVNGTRFKDVGIRPKGNSSLNQVAQSDSDRYSFRLKFDAYVENQTCFGLESFVVNNMLGDNSYMKEYLSYDLMKAAGVQTPYFDYANIKVNGKAWGLYLAVELYNDSYETRVYGDTKGMLYNVKMNMNQNQRPQENTPGGPMGAASTGGSLAYTDDNSDSYSSIFENAVGKSTEADYQRVIKALKALSDGTDLETYYDVDAILRYLAAHTVVVNLDSYVSTMAQNYYLYERDGQLTVLPWDYNLAWGGFQSKDASSVVNFPIDTPVSGVSLEDRPLISKLLADDDNLEKYHEYLTTLMKDYFSNGKFEAKVKSLDTLINSAVKSDATAFCSYEAYEKAVIAMVDLGKLRAQSIEGQLNGTIPSTSEGQTTDPSHLVSTGTLNLSDLGSMMGGKGGPDGFMPNGKGGPGGFNPQNTPPPKKP